MTGDDDSGDGGETVMAGFCEGLLISAGWHSMGGSGGVSA